MKDRRRRTIPLILLLVALYIGWVLVGTELNVYQVKTAAKAGCQKMMVYSSQKEMPDNERQRVRNKTLSRIRTHDVHVSDEDLSFELSAQCNRKGCSCNFEVSYKAETAWPLLSDFFDTLPPWKREGKKTGSVDYKAFY